MQSILLNNTNYFFSTEERYKMFEGPIQSHEFNRQRKRFLRNHISNKWKKIINKKEHRWLSQQCFSEPRKTAVNFKCELKEDNQWVLEKDILKLYYSNLA